MTQTAPTPRILPRGCAVLSPAEVMAQRLALDASNALLTEVAPTAPRDVALRILRRIAANKMRLSALPDGMRDRLQRGRP